MTPASGTSAWKSSQQRSVRCQCAGFPGKQVTVEKYNFWGWEATLESTILSFFSWSHEPHLLGKSVLAVTWPHKKSQSKSSREEAQSSPEKTPLVLACLDEMYIQYCINAIITSQLLVIWPLLNNSSPFVGMLNNSPSDSCWPTEEGTALMRIEKGTTGIKASSGWQSD